MDDDIKITVLSIDGSHVRIGFEAPIDIDIWREELYNKSNKKTTKE